MFCEVSLYVFILVSLLQRQCNTKGLGTSNFFFLYKIFFLRLRAGSFILFLIFKESERVKFSYLGAIDDPLAPCFSDDFENPTSFPWLSVYWRERKIYLSGVSNMKNVHTLLKDDSDVNMIKGKHGVTFRNKAVII